jgi:hypothetical protein
MNVKCEMKSCSFLPWGAAECGIEEIFERGGLLNNELNAEECDATDDAMKIKSRVTKNLERNNKHTFQKHKRTNNKKT